MHHNCSSELPARIVNSNCTMVKAITRRPIMTVKYFNDYEGKTAILAVDTEAPIVTKCNKFPNSAYLQLR